VNRFSRDASKGHNTSPSSAGNTVITAPKSGAEASLRTTKAGASPEDARRLLEEVQQLGARMRNNRRQAQQIDRRATAYASRLARHTARLLQHMPHAVPAVRPVPGTGASALRHYVLNHDQLEAPDRTRLLVVSSDGRLRICTVLSYGPGSRWWDDYEVANPPAGLGLSVVFEGLSSLIVKLETAVVEAEHAASDHEHAIDGLIAQSEAKLAHAGSRLSPVDDLADDAADADVYGETPSGELRSYGFEHRIAFGATHAVPRTEAAARSAANAPVRDAPAGANVRATSAGEKPAAATRAPGRFSR